jgi:transglutaminase-like putative cysteine protease
MTTKNETLLDGYLRCASPGRNRVQRLTLSSQTSLLIAFLIALLLPCENARAGDDLPPWLRSAASSAAPSYARTVPAVVLLSERNIKVDEDGKVTTTERRAIKLLTNEGRGEAVAVVPYLTDTGSVRELRAWIIRPAGAVKKLGKDEVLDMAAAPNDVFNEVRIRVISGRDDAEAGAVFGYEWTTEDRSLFTQFDWQFQDRLPTAISRVTITLPGGWRADGVTLNHARIEPTATGSSYSWELRDLPYIEEEPASPRVTTLAPRLAVSYFPPADKKAGLGRVFKDWRDVSLWLTELSESQSLINDALAGKAKQLIANAKSELERIQAIGRYVQGVNYVAIQTGIGRGGGYRPHSSLEVFAKSYGDCKDKANLMRAMLKAVGIKSYLVSIFSGDRTFVREEWASPQQFNHCIIAVVISDATQAAIIVNHPTLGRLLIFDPTDDNTPVGDLPGHEQGSLGLVVAGDAGALLRMPTTTPESNLLERHAEVVLAPDGSISAKLHDRASGQSAVAQRGEFRSMPRSDYVKRIEGWITNGASGASVSRVEPSDNSTEGRFSLDVDFNAHAYGQLMQNRLLVFKPTIVSRREYLFLTDAVRKYPVVLEGHAYTETVTVKLPAGFEVDDLPDAVKLDTAFGSYSTSYIVKDGQLLFTRKLIVRASTIPVTDYAKVRGFFERIRAAEQSPVVLVKK